MDKNNVKIIIFAVLSIILAAAVLGLAVLAAGEVQTGEAPAEDVPQQAETIPFGYEENLFDTSYVHSLDIRMPTEDWEPLRTASF